jgi:hypothetical protein
VAGEDMNQYIITEELLGQIQTRKRKFPYGERYGSQFEPLAYWEIDELVEQVRSHPYQSERDKVLDELTRFLLVEDKGIALRSSLLKKIDELRQQAGDR